MFPIEHCEKFISPLVATGLIKNWALASQVLVVSGQQALVLLHPAAHYEPKVSRTVNGEWIRYDTYIMLKKNWPECVHSSDKKISYQEENGRTMAPKLWPIS